MGTLTSIVEQVWTLLQGNFMFLLETILGFLRLGTRAKSVIWLSMSNTSTFQ